MKRISLVLIIATLAVSMAFANGESETASKKGLDYPTKAVNFVVPAGPGATMDILVRGLDKALDLGQPLAISNMGGASQTLGLAEVASRKADGYTLTSSGAAGTLIQPLILDLSYSMEDFRYLSLLNDAIPNAIGASAKSQYKSWADVTAALKAGKKVRYTSPNTGSVGHMAALSLFSKCEGNENAVYVSYNGSAEADNAIINGDVDIIVNDVDLIMDRANQGQYRCLLVLNKERSEVAPEVPCSAEVGIAGLENFMGMTWIMVKADTPEEIVTYIKAKLDEAIASQSYIDFLATINKKPVRVLSEKELTEMLYNSREAYRSVISNMSK